MEEELNQKQKKIFTEFIKIFNNEEKLEVLTNFIDLIDNNDLQNGIDGIEEINKNETEIKDIFKEIQEIKKDAQTSQEHIDEVYWSIFDKSEKEVRESSKLKNIEYATKIALKIQEDNKRFYGYKDSNGNIVQGVISKLNEACEQIEENKEKIEALQEFYKEVFEGKEYDQNGKGGKPSLVKFLDAQKNILKETIALGEQKLERCLIDYDRKLGELYKEKQDKIESLLPGATSAGLANAYKEQRNDAEEKIKNWDKAFKFSICSFIAVFVIYFALSFKDGFDYTSLARSLPFWIFSGFFTWYSTKQISEYKRIANEYRHKESLSSSYVGFEKAIEESNQEELKNKLLDIAIDAIKVNPSDTINPKGELPSFTMLEKTIDFLPVEKLKKVSEMVNKRLSKN